jgi:hypothetical protein
LNEVAVDYFENGVFWELYLDLEHQFENFLEYVPFLKGNEMTYSFKLLNMIVSIGGHIDSAFKEMARYPKFASNDRCKKILEKLEETKVNIQRGKQPKPISIKLCLEVFETEYRLSEKYVAFKKRDGTPYIITPFENWSSKRVPEWWAIYNNLKHDIGSNIEKANLLNTTHALAGAFLLNVIHLPAAIRMYKKHIIKPSPQFHNEIVIGPKPEYYLTTEEKLRSYYEKHKHFLGIVETPLFIFSHEAKR